jgi:predicted nucleotidyltransferase
MEPIEKLDDPMLAEIVRRLVAAYQPERIYLFGSKARGDAGPDSDYDLMILVPDEVPSPPQRSRKTYEALRGLGFGSAADVLVWTREEFEKRLHLRASLPSTILREGRLLFRYPGDEPSLTLEEPTAALALAREALDVVLSRLPDATHP